MLIFTAAGREVPSFGIQFPKLGHNFFARAQKGTQPFSCHTYSRRWSGYWSQMHSCRCDRSSSLSRGQGTQLRGQWIMGNQTLPGLTVVATVCIPSNQRNTLNFSLAAIWNLEAKRQLKMSFTLWAEAEQSASSNEQCWLHHESKTETHEWEQLFHLKLPAPK